jgi:hypothetical protein
MFDMQRAAIENTQSMAESGLTFGLTATGAVVDAMGTGKSVQKSGVQLSQRAAHAYLDAMADAGAGEGVEDVRQFVDEQFAAFDSFHDEAWEAFENGLEEFEHSADELGEAQREMLADAFEALLAAQADVEAAAEDATEAVDIDVDEA